MKKNKQGFSLIELVVTISIIAIIAGMLAPAGAMLIDNKLLAQTKSDMEVLKDGIIQYYRDMGSFPSDLIYLKTSTGSAAWKGPYVIPQVVDSSDPDSGNIKKDKWRQAYSYISTGTYSRRIVSNGIDKTYNTSDDIILDVDVQHILRERTLEDLNLLNSLIVVYNSYTAKDSDLYPPIYNSTNWSSALLRLENVPLIAKRADNNSKYYKDAWGSVYLFDRTKVYSSHVK